MEREPNTRSSVDTVEKSSRELEDTRSYSTDIEEGKSNGVLRAEILANQWKGNFYYQIILLVSAFLVGYGYGLDGQVRYIFTSYATASYSQHSLLTTIGVITSVAGAACQPIFARLSDVIGRLEIFICCIVLYSVGTIIESQAHDIQRYAGGSVLYQVGYTGVLIVLMFMLADFSSLKWRLFYLLVPTLPFIINTWIAGNVIAAVDPLNHWSWGVGMWAFIFPLTCLPMIGCMAHMRWMAGKTTEWAEFKQKKTKFQELGFWGFVKFLFWSLDIIGLIIMTVCLGCILVPLTLAGGVSTKWKSGSIVAPIVIGVVLIPAFVAWEAYGARHPIAPFKLLKDRGIWAALIICCFLNLIFAVESSYLYAVLRVAVNQSDTSATRITSLGSFVSVIGGFFFGLFIVVFRRLKFFIIFGVATWMIALGVLFHFRSGTAAYAGIIGGTVLFGFGTTFFTYPVNVSLQTCTNHEHMAIVISLGFTVYRIGSAVGSAIAGALWTQQLFNKLKEKMGSVELATSAYTDPYTFIAKYAWASTERQQMVLAYRDLQRILIMVALILCVPMLIAGFLLRDHVLDSEQSHDEILRKEADDTVFGFFMNSFTSKDWKKDFRSFLGKSTPEEKSVPKVEQTV